MLRQRTLVAILGIPVLLLLLWGNHLLRASTLRLGSDDLLLLLLVLIITGFSGWEISRVVRHRFSGAAEWNGVNAAFLIPFLLHTIRPGSAVTVSDVGLLIDSVGATACVMLLFLGIWGDVERRGRDGLRENLLVVPAGLYVGLTTSCLLLLSVTPFHELAVLYLFAAVFALDTAAYFGGRCIGGARLAPSISPNKTWAGSISGLLGASLASLVFLPGPMGAALHWWGLLLLGTGIACIGQVGDLLESRFKRWGGVKDSGSTLPGHGGFLDRFDSFFLAAPLCYLLILLLTR